MRPSPLWIALACLAGCEPAENVRVLPLPELDRPSAEARAGLPEVAGEWRLAGVETVGADSAAAQRLLRTVAVLVVGTQRLDSLAAVFAAPGVRLPLVGEVRRDGTVALAGRGPAGESVILAGRVARDTLWLELAIPAAAVPWEAGGRAALVRGVPEPRFARLPDGAVLILSAAPPPPAPVADSAALAADSIVAPPRASLPPSAEPRVPTTAPRPAAPVAQPRPPVLPRPAPDTIADSLPPEPVPPDTPRVEVEP